MSFFKKIADTLSGNEDDNYKDIYSDGETDEEYDDADDGEEIRQEPKKEQREKQDRYQHRAAEQPQARSYQPQGVGVSLEMKVIKPENKLDSVNMIGEHLMKGRTVIINFEDTSKEIMTRIIDFIGGLCYATGAQLKRSSSYTFILSPRNVQVSSDQLDESGVSEQQAGIF